jgi:hypothetical protein
MFQWERRGLEEEEEEEDTDVYMKTVGSKVFQVEVF